MTEEEVAPLVPAGLLFLRAVITPCGKGSWGPFRRTQPRCPASALAVDQLPPSHGTGPCPRRQVSSFTQAQAPGSDFDQELRAEPWSHCLEVLSEAQVSPAPSISQRPCAYAVQGPSLGHVPRGGMRGYRWGCMDPANSLSLPEWVPTTLRTGLLWPHPGDGLWQQGQSSCPPPTYWTDPARASSLPSQGGQRGQGPGLAEP